jgi:hypothetical protein
LVEHLVCNQAVVGSNPVASTSELGGRELVATVMVAGRKAAWLVHARLFENKVNRKESGSHEYSNKRARG